MAGGANLGGDDEGITGINVTPFVDISLVLLVVFMVTAKYIVSQSIPVDLPRASTAEETQQASLVNVSIDRAGRAFVDTNPVDAAALREAMRTRLSANPELRAVLHADRNTSHGRVTEVIDLLRQAGVSRFAIETVNSEEPSGTESAR